MLLFLCQDSVTFPPRCYLALSPFSRDVEQDKKNKITRTRVPTEESKDCIAFPLFPVEQETLINE